MRNENIYLIDLTTLQIIPACEDLVSIAIDVWCLEEDVDSTRLAMATDINTKTLVLTDLQPPPLCRFIKVNVESIVQLKLCGEIVKCFSTFLR